MPKSLFNNGVDKALDILKTYLFYVKFDIEAGTALENVLKAYGGANNNALTIRARQAKWAGKSFEDLSTIFMGSKVNYPGMPKVDGDLKIVFDEFQDTQVIKFLSAWMNLMFNSNFSKDTDAQDNDLTDSITKGGSYSSAKKDYSCDISVYITDSTTNYEVPIYCKFYNCYPKQFADMSLDSTQNGNVKPDIDFRYDYFEYKNSPNYNPKATLGPRGTAFENF